MAPRPAASVPSQARAQGPRVGTGTGDAAPGPGPGAGGGGGGSGDGGETVLATSSMSCDTSVAASHSVLPGWLAVTLQMPALTMVTVAPETVQTPGVVLA